MQSLIVDDEMLATKIIRDCQRYLIEPHLLFEQDDSEQDSSKYSYIEIQFLKDIFHGMHMDVKIETKETLDGIVLDLHGEDLGILIGKHGQTLDALQYLTNLAANRDMSEAKIRIMIDVENYRKRHCN